MLCTSCPVECLVEQSEAHVIIFLRLGLGFLGSGSGSRGGITSRSSTSSSWGTSGRDGAELLSSLLYQLLDVLAGELGHHLVHLLIIGVNTNGTRKKNLC